MPDQPPAPSLLIRPDSVAPFDRGNGVVTIPYVGKWNCETNRITTGLSNASFRLYRGSASRTVVLSRLGRVRVTRP